MATLLPAELKTGALLRLGAGGEAARLRDVAGMLTVWKIQIPATSSTMLYERNSKICAGWEKGRREDDVVVAEMGWWLAAA